GGAETLRFLVALLHGVESGLEALRHFLDCVVRPEMHEVQVRRSMDQMIVKGCHHDAVLGQCLCDSIHLISNHDKVPSRSYFSLSCLVKIECCRHPQSGRNSYP